MGTATLSFLLNTLILMPHPNYVPTYILLLLLQLFTDLLKLHSAINSPIMQCSHTGPLEECIALFIKKLLDPKLNKCWLNKRSEVPVTGQRKFTSSAQQQVVALEPFGRRRFLFSSAETASGCDFERSGCVSENETAIIVLFF